MSDFSRFLPLGLLFFSHIWADYFFQTKRFVRKKRKNDLYLLIHVFAVWVFSILFFLPYQNAGVYVVLTGLAFSHLIIDRTKIRLKKVHSGLNQKQLNILDQCLHFLVIVLVWRLFFLELPLPSFFRQHPLFLKYFVIFIIILMATKAIPSILKEEKENDFDTETRDDPGRHSGSNKKD